MRTSFGAVRRCARPLRFVGLAASFAADRLVAPWPSWCSDATAAHRIGAAAAACEARGATPTRAPPRAAAGRDARAPPTIRVTTGPRAVGGGELDAPDTGGGAAAASPREPVSFHMEGVEDVTSSPASCRGSSERPVCRRRDRGHRGKRTAWPDRKRLSLRCRPRRSFDARRNAKSPGLGFARHRRATHPMDRCREARRPGGEVTAVYSAGTQSAVRPAPRSVGAQNSSNNTAITSRASALASR